MALLTKTDYFGLASNGFIVESTSENRSVGYTAEARSNDGFLVAIDAGGERISPTVNYIATDSASVGSIVMGSVNTVDGKAIALNSITITTGAGENAKMTASGQQIEDGGSAHCTATLNGITLDEPFHASTFGLFTVSNGQLTNSTLTIEGTTATAETDGVIRASDLVGASIKVSGTIVGVSDAGAIAKPTITLNAPSGNVLDGVLTQPLSEENPNGDFPQYSFEATWGMTAD